MFFLVLKAKKILCVEVQITIIFWERQSLLLRARLLTVWSDMLRILGKQDNKMAALAQQSNVSGN